MLLENSPIRSDSGRKRCRSRDGCRDRSKSLTRDTFGQMLVLGTCHEHAHRSRGSIGLKAAEVLRWSDHVIRRGERDLLISGSGAGRDSGSRRVRKQVATAVVKSDQMLI